MYTPTFAESSSPAIAGSPTWMLAGALEGTSSRCGAECGERYIHVPHGHLPDDIGNIATCPNHGGAERVLAITGNIV